MLQKDVELTVGKEEVLQKEVELTVGKDEMLQKEVELTQQCLMVNPKECKTNPDYKKTTCLCPNGLHFLQCGSVSRCQI